MTFDSNSTNKKRQRSDRWSRYVVTGFGGLVLLTLVILITHLISQALPLAYTPSLNHLLSLKTPDNEKIFLGLNNGSQAIPKEDSVEAV